MKTNPSETLVGKILNETWKVTKLLSTENKESTGGFFSKSYKVVNIQTKKEAFLKVIDLLKALQVTYENVPVVEAIQRVAANHQFEVELSEVCKSKRMSRVVHALDHGQVPLETEMGTYNFPFIALASLGRIQEARQHFDSIKLENLNVTEAICLAATQGLLEFRGGNPEDGRQLYRRAAQVALARDQPELRAAAIFHLASEEDRIASGQAQETKKEAERLLAKCKSPIADLLSQRLKGIKFELPKDVKVSSK